MAMDNSAVVQAAAAAAPQKPSTIPISKYSKRVLLRDLINNPDFAGQRVVVGGWVKSSREIKTETPTPTVVSTQQPNKDIDCVEILQTKLPFVRSFLKLFGISHTCPIRDKIVSHNIPKQSSLAMLQISDGSSVASLQVLIESSVLPTSQVLPTGTCILVDGLLQLPSSSAGKHALELKVTRVLHIGTVDQATYPLSKKRLPLHLLRDSAHFRPRTTTVGSITRIRSALNEGIHNFFQLNGFLFVQVPIITATDAEGSSQKFQVMTDLNLKEALDQEQENPGNRNNREDISLETLKASIEEKSKQVEELKRSDSNREAALAATRDLHKTTKLLESQLTESANRRKNTNTMNSPADFFGRQAYLTVSGRLHLQSYASALGNVYSCGPRFRAENIIIRGALETWMTEVEIAFSEMEDAINCAEDLVKHVSQWALENCKEDLKFLGKRVDEGILDRLKSNTDVNPFQRLSYSEALEVLNEVKGKKGEGKVEWGRSLTEEDESYLAEEIYKKGVIIYNHPKQVKPFYMRVNEDGRTVASFDIIMSKGGRVISGGENEQRNGVLRQRIKEMGLMESEYEWYLELTRQGGVKSSGFSMFFDLLSTHATGLLDVRDAIPFSRTPGQLLKN